MNAQFTPASLQASRAWAKKLTREKKKNDERILREKVSPSFSPLIIRLDELGQTFCSSSGYGKKTGTGYASRGNTFRSASFIMRLVPVFILETHSQTNYKCLPKFVLTDNASLLLKTTLDKSSSSIKTAIFY